MSERETIARVIYEHHYCPLPDFIPWENLADDREDKDDCLQLADTILAALKKVAA